MAVRSILSIGHPALREVAREVTPTELDSTAIQTLIDDLIDTMRDANGAGLAATQVGEPLRICLLYTSPSPRDGTKDLVCRLLL